MFEEMFILSVVEFLDKNDLHPLMILLTTVTSAVIFFQLYLILIICIFSLVSL
jgi:hypothetical protein